MTRTLVALGLLWQASLPASAAVARANGLDLGEYVCGSPGHNLTPEAERLALTIASLIGDDAADDEQASTGGCPLCVLAHGAPLPEIEAPAQRASLAYRADRPLPVAIVVHAPRGPPVGAQAPPTLI